MTLNPNPYANPNPDQARAEWFDPEARLPFPPPPPPAPKPPPPPWSPASVPAAQCHPGCQQAQASAQALIDRARNVDNAYGPDNYYSLGCDAEEPFPEGADGSWFYFTGAAGRRMQADPPGGRTCGTQYAGWLSTPHPEVGQPPTPGVVCFDADRGAYKDCYMSTEVEVCACEADRGTLYMYRLPRPPRCYAAYCGTGWRLEQDAVTSPSSLVVTGIRAPPVHTPMKPSAYARRCYVTVRVQSAGFGGEGDYVVSTMVNGEQVPTTKPSSLLLT